MSRPAQTEVVRLVRAVFGTAVVGVCLHGSAVLGGGMRPHSDIDLFAVLLRRTTARERRARRRRPGRCPISRR